MDNTSLPVKFSRRAISWLVISTLVWQPMAPAVAAAISPTGPASMDKAANGVPVLNIATPNGAGISHNQFKDYNVGKEGLILNNATGQLNQTQLGGIIQNNPRLRAGQEAKGIINEVTGGSRSQLKGYTEVAGKAANVMVANPYGITCDGCGFINTPNVTLTTGKPQFDEKGNLSALNVTGGTITVEGKGLDASNGSALSLISRATEVNAAIHAKDLQVIAGANRVGADGSVTAIEGEGTAPTVAVDTGVLGGMYANRIHLVSSEKGVGVNLGNLNARQGDITLDASGKLVLKDSLAGGALDARADEVQLSGSLKTGGALTVAGQQAVNVDNATLASDGRLTLQSRDGNTTLTGSQLTGGEIALAGKKLAIDGQSQADSAGETALTADEIVNRGKLIAGGDTRLKATQADNHGLIAAKGHLETDGDTLNNTGTLQGGTLALSGEAIDNNGTLAADTALKVNTGSLNTGADSVLTSKGDIALTAVQNASLDGRINADGALSVTADSLLTRKTSQLQSTGDLTLKATGDARLEGTHAGKGKMAVDAQSIAHKGKSAAAAIDLKAGSLLENNGTLVGDTLALKGEQISNSGLLKGTDRLTLEGNTLDNLTGGTLYGGNLAFNGGTLSNNGVIAADKQTTLRADALNNTGEIKARTLDLAADSLTNKGVLQGSDLLSITGDRVDNQQGGKILSGDRLAITADKVDNSGLWQGKNVLLDARTFGNQGEVQSADALQLQVRENLTTRAGSKIAAMGDAALQTLALTHAGEWSAKNLTLQADSLDNSGTLLGSSQLTLSGGQITQQQNGKLMSGGDLRLDATGLNALGQIIAIGDLALTLADTLSSQATMVAGKSLAINSGGGLNNQGRMQGQSLELNAVGRLANGGEITVGTGKTAFSGGDIVIDKGGSLQSGGDITLNSLSNITVNGFIGSPGNLTLSAPGSILNTALMYAANNMALYADRITNQRGEMLAGNNLTLQRDVEGNANTEVVNTSGTIETQKGDIAINTGKLLNTREGLSVTKETKTYNVGAAPSITVNKDTIPGYYVQKRFWNEKKGGGSNQENGTAYDVSNYIYDFIPDELYKIKRIASSETILTVVSTGGVARIQSGKDFLGNIETLENKASFIVAVGDINVHGKTLNNQSYQDGTNTDYLVYTFRLPSVENRGYTEAGAAPQVYGSGRDKYIKKSINASGDYNIIKLSGSDQYYDYFSDFGNKYRITHDGNMLFVLTGNETVQNNGQLYRSVIQAGGTIDATFADDINNTNLTANAGGVSSTITTPALNAVSQQDASSAVDQAANGSAWQDQLQKSLQLISGGTAGGKPVDTSAWPLPSGNSGYFVTSDNPKSPYLITVNPALDKLGALDPALFGDLNKLLGTQPGAAPRETNAQYTDAGNFLGSAYMLGRLNINPENDYRFLGDAAFDTRYVTNAVLNQTGNRYLNGVGSELEQMRYLMDSAAAAAQPLGLQLGVALTMDQIAALDHSILWWESATINGQTVMVPKVYLSPKDVTVHNGSVMAANTLNLDGGKVTNDGSTILAKNDLTIDSQSGINNLNSGQLNAGGALNLKANGDINNLSASISGKTVGLESVDGDINNIRRAEQFTLGTSAKSGSVSLKTTATGSEASIRAQDGLSLDAGGNITNTGASLKSGGDLLMQAGGDIAIGANQINDTRSESGLLSRSANGNSLVTWQGSDIQAGGDLAIRADGDLTLTASDIKANDSALLTAGNDLSLNAGQTSKSSYSGYARSYNTSADRSSISAGDNLTLTAGRDLISQAASLAAGEQAGLEAGRDVSLQAETTTWGNSSREKKHTVINDHIRQQGTEITSGGDTVIIAGRDVTSKASLVMAQEDIGVQAGRDVNLTTATESDYYYREETKTKKGFLSKKTTTTIQEDSATSEKGTLLSGTNVSVEAGKNILVNGSQVVGDEEVALKAGDNIDILAATNTNSSWRFSETKKSGLMGSGGIGFTIGSSKTTHDLKEKGTTQSQSMSTVGSTGGSVTLDAGEQVHIGAADLIAKKDLSLSADSVVIESGHDKRISDQTFEQKSSGLTLALSGAVGDVVNTAVSTAIEAKAQSDDRLASLQATKAVLSGIQAGQASRLAEAASGGDMTKNGAFGVMVSLGGQSSKSTSHSEQVTAIASTLNAGNDLGVTANGKGSSANSGDIAVSGSQVKAGKDITLDAARDITLNAAANTQVTTGSNSSKGGSLGVGITAGPDGAGFTVSASANASKGGEKGNGTAWNETTLDAGSNVNLTSGRDALLQGAQVNGDKVTADIGRDLTLRSLQDSNDYNSKQQSLSGGLSYTFGPGGGVGVNISYSRDKMKSNYDSVQEQTGIFAGEGGFDINVGSHSQLDGAVIASRAEADKNRLETGTLGFTDISNKADYKVEHQGGGFSTSGGIAGNVIGNMASTLLTGLSGSGHAEGTTQSAVADGTIIVRDVAHQQQDVSTLSRDTDNANGSIDPIFNKEKEQRRLQTAQLIGEIGRQVSDIVRTDAKIRATETANTMMEKATADDRAAAIKALEKEKKAVTEEAISGQMYQTFYNDAFAKTEQGTGGQYQRAITAATAAIQAIAGGDIKGALAGAAAPYIANEIAKAIPETERAGRVLAHAIVNAALAAASGKDAGTAAAGAATGELAGMIALDAWDKTVDQLSEEEKQTVSALATLASGLAGGLVGDSGASAVAGAQAGKTVVENNFLSDKKSERLTRALENQKAGKDLVKASIDIVQLTNEDNASNRLVAKFREGKLDDIEKRQLASLLNQYGQELQTIHGYSRAQAAEAIQTLLNGGAFVASAADAKAYNEAISYLKGAGVQYTQATIGTEPLLALPGVPGVLVRGAIIAGGSYQTGMGVGQIIDGNYGDGALNIGLGSLAIFGNIAGQKIVSNAGNTLPKGQVTYEFGAKPNGNESRAGSAFSELGYDVTYKTTASDRGISDVRTPDLWVKGVGQVDVYTPETKNLGNIVKAIEKKDSQTTAVLTQIDLPLQDMQSMSARLWGKPSVKNINTLFFQDSKGQIYRFERPTSGVK